MSQRQAEKTLGGNPSDYFWPPEFQAHRDRLRKQERAQEAAAKPELQKLQEGGDPLPKPTPEEDLASVVYSCLFPVALRRLLPTGIQERLDAEGRSILYPPDPDTLQRSLSSLDEFIGLCDQEKRAPARWIIEVKTELEKKAATTRWIRSPVKGAHEKE